MKNIRALLKKIEKESENRLEKWLCNNILSTFKTSEDCQAYLEDILRGGCESGVISELIYYKDIYPFFQEYYLEIQELILNYQDEIGGIELKADIQSRLSWLAVEITALNLADKLCLE